jgi:MAE_28990/MAE_18760-like HEPN
MSKIRSLAHLQSFLDSEFAWRVKEIADLKFAVQSNKGLREATVVRAGIPLLYAHWEGFVKAAATSYLEYVNSQGKKYADLEDCFIIFGLKKHLHTLATSKKTKINLEALQFIRASMQEKAMLQIASAVDTESNLSSAVFENIATSIGIDSSKYQAKFNLIDESLLKRRNKIAHGEFLDMNAKAWRELADEILDLLRTFKTDIENAASSSNFLTTTPRALVETENEQTGLNSMEF